MDPIPEPPESPRLLRPRGVGEILVDAFGLYRLHWRNLIAIVAVVVVPLTILQVLVTDVLVDERQVELGDGTVEISRGDVATLLVALLTVLIVGVLTWAIVTGAITRAAAGTFLGRDLRIEDTYRYGFARLGSIVLVGILVGLAVLGGLILLVIPGLFVLTRLWVSMPALVIEDRRGREALRRSWDLVNGFGWPVFGTIVVSVLITGLLSNLLTAPFGENTAGLLIGETVAALVTTPYTVLVGILIYLNLRVRKEQYGIGDLERDLARTNAA